MLRRTAMAGKIIDPAIKIDPLFRSLKQLYEDELYAASSVQIGDSASYRFLCHVKMEAYGTHLVQRNFAYVFLHCCHCFA